MTGRSNRRTANRSAIDIFLSWPLWLSVVVLTLLAIGLSGTAGVAVIAVVVGEVVPISVVLAFTIPALIVPPAAFAQLWAMRRAWRSERELARFFESTEALLAIGDWSGRLFRTSPSWHDLIGFTAEELAEGHFIAFVHPDDVAETIREAKKLGTGEHRSVGFVNRLRRKGGGYVWLQWNATSDPRRKLIYATAVDVTSRVESEALKDALISTVNHEIRTPLAAIYAALKIVQGMQTDCASDQSQRMLKIAETNADRLVRMIDDMLDVQRIEAGTANYQIAPCDVAELLAAVADQARLLHAGSTVALRVVDEAPGAWALADPDRLHQVLSNLLSNAYKFAPPVSDVTLAVRPAGLGLRFTVLDEGPGVPEADRERVFERFYQSGRHNKGGSGLGLAICRTLMRDMGGAIGMEPAPPPGAAFFVEIPAAPPA
ncbi:MAG: PAS domain-containing sensor histidine kinase [Alphaproteobacteria bacterium]